MTPESQTPFLEAWRRTIKVYKDLEFAEMYFARWADDPPCEQLKAFSARLGNAGLVLDAGCGPGHHAAYLHSLGQDVVGVDLSPVALRLAVTHFPGPTFALMNMLNTGFADSTFAGVWACASVMHVPRSFLRQQLMEFNRILVPGGILAVTMTVDEVAHEDAFGRFFEGYSLHDVIHELALMEFDVVEQDRRIRVKTTEQSGQQASWVTIAAVKIAPPSRKGPPQSSR